MNPDVKAPVERRRLVVSGRVQGVGFRATAMGVARRFPVTGFVRNEPDGTVLIEVQGLSGAIDAFVLALRNRMEANIQGIDSLPMAQTDGEQGFLIDR